MYNKQEYRILQPLNGYKGLIDKLKNAEAMLCGGAILSVFTNKPINDYDFYFRSKEKAEEVSSWLSKNGFSVGFKSENAISYISIVGELKIQIMGIDNKSLLAPNPMSIFDLFDFTCCMGAYDFKNSQFSLDNKFLTSIAAKELEFNPLTKYPICSLFRTLKYQRKGFHLSGLEIITMAMAINALEITNYKELKSQLRGIDTEQLNAFCEELDKTKKDEDAFSVQEFFQLFTKWKQSLYEFNDEKTTTVLIMDPLLGSWTEERPTTAADIGISDYLSSAMNMRDLTNMIGHGGVE